MSEVWKSLVFTIIKAVSVSGSVLSALKQTNKSKSIICSPIPTYGYKQGVTLPRSWEVPWSTKKQLDPGQTYIASHGTRAEWD